MRTRRPLVASSYSTLALPSQAPTLLPTQEASCLRVGIKTGTRERWWGPPWGPGRLGSSENHHHRLKTRLTVRMMPRRRTKGSHVFTKAPTLTGESTGARSGEQADGPEPSPSDPTGLKVLGGSWNLFLSLVCQGTGPRLMPTL